MSCHRPLAPLLRLVAAAAVVSLLADACGSSTVSPPVETVSPPVETPAGSAGITVSPSAGQPADCGPSGPAPSGGAAPWWRDRTFYEVFVRSFADSDGDGIGDLRGLTDRLDYLNDGDPTTTTDLGVTALWLMPVTQSPSYHGYDVTDYKAIEQDYGTADDFRALMTAAHARGIDVIVDLVLNHTSVDHPWFKDAVTPGSKHDDWYVWSSGAKPPFAGPSGNAVWHRSGDRWYYGYFDASMPDLNLRNPEVIAAIDDVARFWLDDLGVDGFRLDAARHLIEDGKTLQNTPETFAWLAAFRDRVHVDRPAALVLGEDWDPTVISSRYVREGSLDMDFEFDFADAIRGSISSHDAGSYRAAEREIQDGYPQDGFGTFLSNHDQNRILTQLGGNIAAAKLAATLLLTSPGVPFVYYGEEIGMTGAKPDERIRTPMRWDATATTAGFTGGTPWEPLSDDPGATSVAGESADPASLLSTYRDLIRLRMASPALSHGDWTPIDSDNRAVNAYLRQADGEDVLVLSNLGDQPISRPTLALDAGPLCGSPTATPLLGDRAVRPPAVTSSGGFADYAPVDRLDPFQAIAIRLAP
jgi:glycosidase